LAHNPFRNNPISSELDIDTGLVDRKYGFRDRCSKFIEIEETITLPKYQKAKHIPVFNITDNEVSGFEASYNLKGTKLSLKAKHRLNKRVYDAEDWKNFKSTLIERYKLMDSQIILER